MIIWVIAGLLGLATGLRIGWALVNKQSLVSTAMILALGSLALVAALNWEPLALLIDTALHCPNISVGLSQVALIMCAAGSCVMITTASSGRKPATIRRIALFQYLVAAVIAGLTLLKFFSSGRRDEVAPQEYLQRTLGSRHGVMSWLPPLLYVMLALTLVVWAGMRNSNRTRRGRALFVFSVGMVLIVLAIAFVLLRAVGRSSVLGVGTAATLLGCAMLVVAGGSLLPSIEDWFGARAELRVIAPLLAELNNRHPDVGIGVRPRGPLLFRVAEQMSLISDSLYLEATAAEALKRRFVEAAGGKSDFVDRTDDVSDLAEMSELDPPTVSAEEQARGIAEWIHSGRGDARDSANRTFPGLNWLRQPVTLSDREWILAIAGQYRVLHEADSR